MKISVHMQTNIFNRFFVYDNKKEEQRRLRQGENMEFKREITDCPCGMVHRCPTKEVVIREHAIEAVPSLLNGYRNIMLVSDMNTFKVCGSKVLQLLKDSNFNVINHVFQNGNHVVIPNEDSLKQLPEKLKPDTDVIVGVGSGVINDLCKYTSFLHHIPYMIIATAPSMDGFASVGAALILTGMKVTKDSHVPTWIVGDVDILKEAPLRMIQAGVGDIIGKYSCLNDWKISHIINNEYFCQNIYDLVYEQVKNCRQDILLYNKRDSGCIERLMNSLVVVGFAMSYVGNSRPASGSEHHLSHFYEIVNILRGNHYLPHGVDVGYGAVVTCGLRHMLIDSGFNSFDPCFDEKKWNNDIDKIYGKIAPEIKALQKKVGFYDTSRLDQIKTHWDEIIDVLKEAPTADEIMGLLSNIGFSQEEYWGTYGKEMIEQSIVYCKDLKNRYTFLWMLQDIGLLSTFAKEYTDKYAL